MGNYNYSFPYAGVSLQEIAAKKERARIANLTEIRKRHGQKWA